jgi:hypothetical protein
MSKKLRFDLDVDASALLAANPEAFYSKAYLSEENVAENYRLLPGIKSKTKLGHRTIRQRAAKLIMPIRKLQVRRLERS